MKILKINFESTWGKTPRWKRRLNGFGSYILCAVVSIWSPEVVDMTLYQELKKQFLEE